MIADSTDRGSADFFHFGLIFAGIIVGAAGIVTLSLAIFLLAGALLGLGVWYFLMEQ